MNDYSLVEDHKYEVISRENGYSLGIMTINRVSDDQKDYYTIIAETIDNNFNHGALKKGGTYIFRNSHEQEELYFNFADIENNYYCFVGQYVNAGVL